MSESRRSAVIRSVPRRSTKSTIRERANELFARNGYAATPLQEIADAVGVSKTALYRHYSSKEKILLELLNEGHTASTRLVQRNAGRQVPPLKRVREYVREHVEWTLENPELFKVGLYAWKHLSEQEMPAELDRRRQYLNYLRQLVEDCQADGSVHAEINPGLATRFLRDAMNSAVSWYRTEGREPSEAVAARVAQLAVDMLSRCRPPVSAPAESRSARRDAHSVDRASRIRRATLRAFCDKGFASTSIQDIADEVGLLKGSVYHYIDAKYDLLTRIFDDAQVQLNSIIESVDHSEAPPRDKLRSMFELQTEWLLSNREQSIILFREWDFLDSKHRNLVVRRRKNLESFLSTLIEQSAGAGAAGSTMALRFVVDAVYASPTWFHLDGESSAAEVAAAYAEFALAVLSPLEPEPA